MGTWLEYVPILYRCWHGRKAGWPFSHSAGTLDKFCQREHVYTCMFQGWLCVCKDSNMHLFICFKNQRLNKKWNLYSFDIKRGLEQEDVWLWKWCCSCYQILPSFYVSFLDVFVQSNWIPRELHLTHVDTPNTSTRMCCASSGGAPHYAS